jgi:hypothetical protein
MIKIPESSKGIKSIDQISKQSVNALGFASYFSSMDVDLT